MTAETISPQRLAELRDGDPKIELIDVRTPIEFREIHADVARNVPLDRLDPAELMNSRNGPAKRPLYIVCRTGSRGNQAREKFAAAGYDNAVNVEGGTQAWEAAGLRVVRGKKVISLERQVRIAAGFLVLMGIRAGVAPSGIPRAVGVRRGRVDICGNDRHLRHGHAAGQNALEPDFGGML